MRLLRVLVTLGVAVVVVLIGLALLSSGRRPVGTVYDTDARGPKISIDETPQIERAPRFRILVGTSRKTARWVEVNPVQYVGCAKGNTWNGTLCSKLDLPSGPAFSGRWVAAGAVITGACLLTAAVNRRG